MHETETASPLPSSPLLVQEPAPRVINTDKNAAYPKAKASLKAAGLLPQQVELRQVLRQVRISQQPDRTRPSVHQTVNAHQEWAFSPSGPHGKHSKDTRS